MYRMCNKNTFYTVAETTRRFTGPLYVIIIIIICITRYWIQRTYPRIRYTTQWRGVRIQNTCTVLHTHNFRFYYYYIFLFISFRFRFFIFLMSEDHLCTQEVHHSVMILLPAKRKFIPDHVLREHIFSLYYWWRSRNNTTYSVLLNNRVLSSVNVLC